VAGQADAFTAFTALLDEPGINRLGVAAISSGAIYFDLKNSGDR
jgi:hypothetical protein